MRSGLLRTRKYTIQQLSFFFFLAVSIFYIVFLSGDQVRMTEQDQMAKNEQS